MMYLLAFAFWVSAFALIGGALWGYFTVTSLLGLGLTAQMIGLLTLVCGFLAVATVRNWDKS